MKIQQHDGVVVDAAGLRQGFANQLREEEEVYQGGGRRQDSGCGCPPSPLLYIGPQGGGRQPLEIRSSRGGGGQGGGVPPKASGEPPHPRVSNPLGAWGGQGGGAPAH